MEHQARELSEFHWLMDMLQTIDVGLVVVDREYQVCVWNGFMENHSGLMPKDVLGKSLFDLFPDIPEKWFRHKIDSVFLLKNRAFTIWEQRPWVFPFRNYRPITGSGGMMYQNLTLNPLVSTTGEVNHVSIVVYDVTDTANNKQDLQRANLELERLSRTDRLTGLLNRGAWESELKAEFRRFMRYKTPSTLVMFDIDHFKKVNDTYGHQAGDAVIREVSALLKQNARLTDICGRYGGEEFAVLLPNTPVASAKVFCERLRKAVEQQVIRYDRHEIRFTISLGAAEPAESFRDHAEWLEKADKALYHSKETGRNRTTLAQD